MEQADLSTVSERAKRVLARFPGLAAEPGIHRLHVLVVDPEPQFRKTIADHVHRMGHIATVFSNCNDAWDCLQNVSFDLVVIDLDTPAISSMELARRIQGFDQVPTLVATSHNIGARQRLGQRMAKGIGFHQVISKGASAKTLGRELERAFRASQNLDEPVIDEQHTDTDEL